MHRSEFKNPSLHAHCCFEKRACAHNSTTISFPRRFYRMGKTISLVLFLVGDNFSVSLRLETFYNDTCSLRRLTNNTIFHLLHTLLPFSWRFSWHSICLYTRHWFGMYKNSSNFTSLLFYCFVAYMLNEKQAFKISFQEHNIYHSLFLLCLILMQFH